MVSLICAISNNTQMDKSVEQKQTHKPGEQTCGCQVGEGVGWGDGLGVWYEQTLTIVYRMDKSQGSIVGHNIL